MRRIAIPIALVVLAASAGLLDDSKVPKGTKSESGLIGKPAREWKELEWLEKPLRLPDLKGRVVLVRWWTRGCSLCTSSAPVLAELHEKYRKDGLVVVGIYHPKPARRPVPAKEAANWAKRLDMRFPIAIDPRWKVLERWWLHHPARRFTSVTFLIDRTGIVRWIHPGGEYHPGDDPRHAECAATYRDLKRRVAGLLAEKPGAGGKRRRKG